MELLRDRSDEFRGGGRPAVRISRDSPWTHVAWMQALDLDFPLLSDWNGDATRGFGVAFDFRGLNDVSERSAFLVDRDGGPRRMAVRDVELPDFDELLSAALGAAAL